LARSLNSTYFEITRKIMSVERDILKFQAGVVDFAGTVAADDSNLAIILAARLSKVWGRLGASAQIRRNRAVICE
jgi:hypothetical protein